MADIQNEIWLKLRIRDLDYKIDDTIKYVGELKAERQKLMDELVELRAARTTGPVIVGS